MFCNEQRHMNYDIILAPLALVFAIVFGEADPPSTTTKGGTVAAATPQRVDKMCSDLRQF